MSKDSRTSHFYIYPKDKNGKHTGHTICVILREGRMFHGECLCSLNDQFNKETGRKLSLERAEAEYFKNKGFEQADYYKVEKSTWIEDSGGINFFYNVEKKEKKNDKTITMTTNKQIDDSWWKDNAFIGKVEDNGNGITITLADGRKEEKDAVVVSLDYSQWENLAHLYKLSYVGSSFVSSEFYEVTQDRTIP